MSPKLVILTKPVHQAEIILNNCKKLRKIISQKKKSAIQNTAYIYQPEQKQNTCFKIEIKRNTTYFFSQ